MRLFKSFLYRLNQSPASVVFTNSDVVPAPSIFRAARLLVHELRQREFPKGGALVLHTSRDPFFLATLIAGLWIEACVLVEGPNSDTQDFPSRALKAGHSKDCDIQPVDSHIPVLKSWVQPHELQPGLILRTSGSRSLGHWVHLSPQNIAACWTSHLPKTEVQTERMTLSLLPWYHCFGLILDILPALMHSHCVLIEAPECLETTLQNHSIERLNAVPGLLENISRSTLQTVQAGVVGGAPISKALAQKLQGTALRAGYGCTQAGPGIALSAKGDFQPGILGKPLGCQVVLGSDAEILVQGPGVSKRKLVKGAIHEDSPSTPLRTGDLGVWSGTNLIFNGRREDAFKLSNGTFVHPHQIESMFEVPVLCEPSREGGFFLSFEVRPPYPPESTLRGLARYLHGVTAPAMLKRDHKGDWIRKIGQRKAASV